MSTPLEPSVLQWGTLCPYASAVVLECTAGDPAQAFAGLERVLSKPGRGRTTDNDRVVALAPFSPGLADIPRLDQLAGFVRQRRDQPAWATSESTFVDTTHYLTVALRHRRLVTVYSDDDGQKERFQRWLDRPPRPQFRRIPAETIAATFGSGETKGLWLRGIHRRRTTKPDTKNISGIRLQDALDPVADATFALGSVRATLVETSDRKNLHGDVGTTPSASTFWFKPIPDFTTFATVMVEAMILLEEALMSPEDSQRVLPYLARKVETLTEVHGAYEVLPADPEFLPPTSHSLEAADVLRRATLNVNGKAGSADFVLDVGLDGAIGGSLRVRPVPSNDGYRLDIGFAGEPTHLPPVRVILDALGKGELLTVYYRSGHTFTNGAIYRDKVPSTTFPNWRVADFTNHKITQEKPDVRPWQDIHDAIGNPEDQSLFGWVARQYREGWLICDDGPGEKADFLHISPDGTLSLIHVKGANSDSCQRGVAVAAYEVVVSQATKNLVYVDPDRLRELLTKPPVPHPACWEHGERISGRSAFIEALDLRDATDTTEIVIVQPHVSLAIRNKLRATTPGQPPNDNQLRLTLLESMLNSARSSAIALGTDLFVVGADVQ